MMLIKTGTIAIVLLSFFQLILISALFNRVNRFFELHMGVYHANGIVTDEDGVFPPMDGDSEYLHDNQVDPILKEQVERDEEFDKRIKQLQDELNEYPQMQEGFNKQQRSGNIAQITEPGVYNLPHKDIPVDIDDAPEISN